ncbi:23095_t:CDS:2, partial [Cetraspora pellucida]
PQSESNNEKIEDSDSSTSEEDKILSGKENTNSSYRYKKNTRIKNSEKNIDDFNNVEYLPVANTTSLLKKVQATNFLSLNKL